MRARRWAVMSAAVLSAAVVGGCGAAGEGRAGEPEATESAAAAERSSPVVAPGGDPADAAAACVAFGDVLTIVENADLALADGRMDAQEHDGWYRLATRVLDRLPPTGDSAVRTAIGDLQRIAPATPSGATTEQGGVRSPEWSDAEAVLGAACDEVGAPLAIDVFTGG